MGANGGEGQPSGILPNGLLPEEAACVTRMLDEERWMEAEERTAELISCIQPNEPSEERRSAIVNYVKQLITNCLECKVFMFGSVPLKTYLPDGDIDLTAFSSNESMKNTWANTVHAVLEKEEKNENAEYRVKEVQYIQAEVKLVKCLVENIVVDISFNQLGGLCTLCFLEETDKLINQNHLFKRSIILIKAWCYYESRVLGAHHGLISTYALETLVLYIFHVFNNKFAGPLEVLYRFLEFFSNFDWDKFCISLWGPIPIHSLPDMTAEPPRKDNGKVLLSKRFLDSQSKKYAAPPGGQENQGLPFVSKHFNVVDPLRANNNLGRSVSKGNFYRVRSAFAFGAKELAKLLECPKEDIVLVVNEFFTNTLKRHGNGNRPDVHTLNLRHLRVLDAVQIEDIHNMKCMIASRKTENFPLNVGYEPLEGTSPDLQDTISELLNDFSQNLQDRHVTSHPSATSLTQNQNDKSRKTLVSTLPPNDQGQGVSQFAGTRSSPERTEASVGLSQSRHNRGLVSLSNQNRHANSDLSSSGVLGPEVTGSNSTMSARHMSSHRSPDVSSDSNSYHNDPDFVKMGEELASVSETLDIQQEQDLVNMMGYCGLHNLNGSVPMHLASPHLPLAFSRVSSSMGYAQRNLAGFLPSNFSVIGPSCEPSMQLHPGLAPLSQYVNSADPDSVPDHITDTVNEGYGKIERNSEESKHEQISRVFNHNDNDTQKILMDVKQPKSHSGLSSIPSPGSTSGVASSRGHKFEKDDKGLAEDGNNNSLEKQTNKGTDNNSSLWGASTKFVPISQVSSRSKSASENLRDASSSKASKLTREIWGKKQAFPSVIISMHGKGGNTSQFESSSAPVPSEVEVLNLTQSNAGSERVSRSLSLSSPHSISQHLPGFGPLTQVPGSDPLIPIGPMTVGTSQQRRTENSNVLPVTFVPTGPPVPFIYYPMYNFTSTTGNDEGSVNQLNIEEVDQFGTNSSVQNASLIESIDHSEDLINSAATRSSAPESSDDHEHKPDILNSDFASHLENLAYGRSCQNLGYPGPLVYSTPFYMPSMYMPTHYPWNGPGRLNPSNLNITDIMSYGSRVPGVPLQPGPGRSFSMFSSYGDEAPRYRGGTGTYLPNPASFRERQSSSRNHRGHGYDRNGHGNREGNGISVKQQRAAGRNKGRNQAEGRGSMRNDRLTARERQTQRLRESYQHAPVSPYIIHNSCMGSTAGIYANATSSSNGMNPTLSVAPPAMMVYSYNQGVGYAPSAEPLEFGTLGPLHLANEVSQANERRRRPYRGVSPQSSPDQPSSP